MAFPVRKAVKPRAVAKKNYEQEGEIPPEDAPRSQYLGAGIEIDAYAHEFAEELLELFGKAKALNIIATRFTPPELEKLNKSTSTNMTRMNLEWPF